MKHLVISTSLNPASNSAVLARSVHELMKNKSNLEIDWIDLRDFSLPSFDGVHAHQHEEANELRARIRSAKGILLATPIYNFSVCSSAKNLLELTGDAWQRKVVSFLCAAGGRISYMSIMPFANSLMLDHRCVMVPNFVYAGEDDFNGSEIINEQVTLRLEELSDVFLSFTQALENI